ncbi:hypothetical protein LG302_01080 [Halomonas organivorans]
MQHFIVSTHNNEKYFLEMPHILYYRLATQSLNNNQAYLKINEKDPVKKGEAPSRRQEELLYQCSLSMNSVHLYAALSLEGCMNYYAQRYEIHFHNDLETLPTLKKWKLYPHLKTGKAMNGKQLKLIKNILDMRNEIAHPKPIKIKAGEPDKPTKEPAQEKMKNQDTCDVIINLNSIYDELFRIDGDEKQWHDDNPWLQRLKKTD